MKVKVTLFIAGTVFDEIVNAVDYADARRTALARNPSGNCCKCYCCILIKIQPLSRFTSIR